MLGLKLATDPYWVNIAEKSIDEILTDHAYCEQKAASTCISLIIQFPDRTELVEEITPIVAEEWGHFRKVLKELKSRGYAFGKNRIDNYVNDSDYCLYISRMISSKIFTMSLWCRRRVITGHFLIWQKCMLQKIKSNKDGRKW